MENLIVGLIVALAAAYTLYRFIRKPSCGCGSSCACRKLDSAPSSSCSCSGGHDGHSSCCCQK